VYHTSRRRHIPCSNRTQIDRTPSSTTTEAEKWSSRAAQGVTNPLARDDHVSGNGELSGRSKRQQNWRTTASKAGRHVSTRDWRNRADLELKNDKTETPQIVPSATRTTDSTPFGSSLESFPAKKQRNPKKTKKQTTIHSPKRLGGLKPSLEQVQGDSKLHKP
jgi:hypothetical protein